MYVRLSDANKGLLNEAVADRELSNMLGGKSKPTEYQGHHRSNRDCYHHSEKRVPHVGQTVKPLQTM